MPTARSEEQRCVATRIACINGGALLDQELRDRLAAGGGRRGKRRHLETIWPIDLSALCSECLRNLETTGMGRKPQRRPPRRVLQIHRRPAVEQHANERRVRALSSDHQGGPAVRIGIFLSIFNVHVNRSPAAARVLRLRYSPGQFLNALNPESTLRNENLWIGLEELDPPHRRLVVRQIAGLFARRIVCNLRSDERIACGHKFGMIKLGSRTELICPDDPSLEIRVLADEKVKAGSTILASYKHSLGESEPTHA